MYTDSVYMCTNNISIVTVGEARSIIISTASPSPTNECITLTSYNTQAKKKMKNMDVYIFIFQMTSNNKILKSTNCIK